MGLFIIWRSMQFSNHTCQHAASYVITFLPCTQIKQIDYREHREKEGTASSTTILVIIANTETKLEQHCVYTEFQSPAMHDLEGETQSTFAAAAEPILKVVFNFFSRTNIYRCLFLSLLHIPSKSIDTLPIAIIFPTNEIQQHHFQIQTFFTNVCC